MGLSSVETHKERFHPATAYFLLHVAIILHYDRQSLKYPISFFPLLTLIYLKITLANAMFYQADQNVATKSGVIQLGPIRFTLTQV